MRDTLAMRLSQPPRPGDEKLLKVENNTGYRTSDLRRFILACCAFMRISARRTVRVEHARNTADGHHGWAYFNSRTAMLRIPPPEGHDLGKRRIGRHVESLIARRDAGEDVKIPESLVEDYTGRIQLDVKKTAQILTHELEHNLGLRHREMPKWWLLSVPWAEGLEIRPKLARAAKPAPTAGDKLAAKEAHARSGLATWERKAKLARTKLAAWKRKVHYYEKRRAASPAPPPSLETP